MWCPPRVLFHNRRCPLLLVTADGHSHGSFQWYLESQRELGSHEGVFQLLSRVRLFVTPWTAARQASLSFTMFRSLLKFTSTESVMLSNHLIFCSLFSFGPQSFLAWRSFPMSRLFASGGRSIGVCLENIYFNSIFPRKKKARVSNSSIIHILGSLPPNSVFDAYNIYVNLLHTYVYICLHM